MSYHLILPFFPEELRALLLDPSISDLMVNWHHGRLCGSERGHRAYPLGDAVFE